MHFQPPHTPTDGRHEASRGDIERLPFCRPRSAPGLNPLSVPRFLRTPRPCLDSDSTSPRFHNDAIDRHGAPNLVSKPQEQHGLIDIRCMLMRHQAEIIMKFNERMTVHEKSLQHAIGTIRDSLHEVQCKLADPLSVQVSSRSPNAADQLACSQSELLSLPPLRKHAATISSVPHANSDMKRISDSFDDSNLPSSSQQWPSMIFAQMIRLQEELREELSCMRSMIAEDAGARKSGLPFPKQSHNEQEKEEEADDDDPSISLKSDKFSPHVEDRVPSQDKDLEQDTLRKNSGQLKMNRRVSTVVLGGSKRSINVHSDVELVTLRQRLSSILTSKELEMLISTALICNALVMCFESQYYGLEVGYKLQYADRVKPANLIWANAEEVFKVLGWTFGIFFLLEFLLKIFCWRHRYFYTAWNWLDFVCIVVFMLDKFMADLLSFNPHMLRLVRLVRLGRLVRLIRYLESLEALYVMTTAIFGLWRILGWAIFLLTLILLTCDLFLVQLLHSTYFSAAVASDLTEEQRTMHHKMYAYFGTVTRCLLSMFEITLGNWPVIARLLSEEVSQFFIILCLAHKLTVGFAVIGVITGVILQETFKVAQTDDIIMLRTKRRQGTVLKRKLENLFYALDEDGDGRLSLAEFQVICEDPDIKTWLGSLDIETDDLPRLFKLCNMDKDPSGHLSIDEIIHRMPRIRGAARSIDLLTMIDELRDAVAHGEVAVTRQNCRGHHVI